VFSNLPRRFFIAALLSITIASGMLAPALASDQPTITISRLNISRQIKEFPLANGTWTIDPWDKGIGHLEQTGWFDNPTNIVLAGHSVMPNGAPGVFANLNALVVGEEIVLFDGSADRRYQVNEIRIVPIEDVSVVMPTGHERLTLITCEISSYDEANQFYTRRLVVIADRVS
jgi:LPXTG-site transpeptidase (sortase) family protein